MSDRLLSRGYVAWLAATTLSATGDGVLFFALAWTATGLGAQVAALVVTAGLLPGVLFTLVGGAMADRWGLRRTIIGCDLAMCVLLAGYLAISGLDLPDALLLAGLALGEGIVDAFHRPADGAFPRLFFDDEALPRGMSLTGTVLSVSRLAGPPLGGIVVVALALRGAALADLVSFALILVVLVAVRPPYEPSPEGGQTSSTLSRILEGLRAARAVPGTAALLGAVALVAGSLLPMLSLCVPLISRSRGWGAGTSGLVEAAWITGTLVVGVLVARTGTRADPTGPLVGGPILAAIGALGVAVAPAPAAALAGAGVMGVGTAVFTSHVFPLFVLRTPEGMLARFQALMTVVQLLPVLIGENVVGAVSSRFGPSWAVVAVAAACASAGVLARSPTAVGRAR
ncbi:MAG TPA: MFS transporter [Nocardioidaceae bacterium]|nr:MFS transporter [Nocardioidaceae bacterium]